MARLKLVAENPFDHLRAPKDMRPVQMKASAPEDLRALWAVAQASGARDYATVTVIAAFGMRAGELVSMGMQRLDLRHGTVWVNGKRGWRTFSLGKPAATRSKPTCTSDPPTGRTHCGSMSMASR